MASPPTLILRRVTEERIDVVLSSVFSHLSARDLARCSTVCRYWREVGAGQELWHPLCKANWAGRAYVPAELVDRAAKHAKCAYSEAEIDARRTHITREELCAFEWHSRMKESSGLAWIQTDPWWCGRPARVRRYSPDGRFEELEPLVAAGDGLPAAPPTVGIHSGRWRFVLHRPGVGTWSHGAAECAADVPTPAPAQGGADAHGRARSSCMLRLSVGDRTFPTMAIARAANWGFVMQNCWGLACSFPMPERGCSASEELDESSELLRAVTIETQHLEATAFNAGLPLPLPEECYEEEPGSDEQQQPAQQAAGASVLITVGSQVHRVPQHLVPFFLATHHDQLFAAAAGGGGGVEAGAGDAVSISDDDEGDGELLSDDSDAD